MDIDLENSKFRLLKGTEATAEETICSIEYQTGTGVATLHGAIQVANGIDKPLRFIQQNSEWVLFWDQEQYPIKETVVDMLLQQEKISLQSLKESSSKIQQEFKK